MSKLWRNRYEELTGFINDQPQVVITEDLVSIDETVRQKFYRKFNNVRASFLAQNFSDWLDQAQFLSTKYGKAEGHLRERLRLEDVLMPVALHRFLSDPMKQAVRDLFDPLFDLLQGKIEPEMFEEKAQESVQESFRDFYQMGYIKWFVLTLIKNVDPERIYEIPLSPPSSKELIKHKEEARQNIPFPCETKMLGFEVGRRDVLLLPDFIVRSAKLERYVAFRTEIGKALWRASYYSEKREWLAIASMIEEYGITELKPDLLLYVGDNLEDVSLVADCDQFCRPDVSIFFMDQLEGAEDRIARKMEGVRLAHQVLNPVRGTCVIAKNHLPENLMKGLDENIQVIHFGFNNLKWEDLMAHLQE